MRHPQTRRSASEAPVSFRRHSHEVTNAEAKLPWKSKSVQNIVLAIAVVFFSSSVSGESLREAAPRAKVGVKIPKIFSYPYRHNTVGITITGELVMGDDERFKDVVLRALRSGRSVESVHIYSPGGSSVAGMEIGRQIRLLRANTFAPSYEDGEFKCAIDSRLSDLNQWTGGSLGMIGYNPSTRAGDERCGCESACFLIWVGGVGRYGQRVGVHRVYIRPYDDGPPYPNYSSLWWERTNTPVQIKITTYLKQMDVPSDIIAVMSSQDPTQIHYLTAEELAKMRNFPIAVSNSVLTRCGSRPQRNNEYAVNWFSCRNAEIDSMLQEGAKAYLKAYGN